MNKNTNDARHCSRQITWGRFPGQGALAGSWALLSPGACCICRSCALCPCRLPGQRRSLSEGSSPCQACSGCHRAGTSSLPSCCKPLPHFQGSFPLLPALCPPFSLPACSPQCFSLTPVRGSFLFHRVPALLGMHPRIKGGAPRNQRLHPPVQDAANSTLQIPRNPFSTLSFSVCINSATHCWIKLYPKSSTSSAKTLHSLQILQLDEGRWRFTMSGMGFLSRSLQ